MLKSTALAAIFLLPLATIAAPIAGNPRLPDQRPDGTDVEVPDLVPRNHEYTNPPSGPQIWTTIGRSQRTKL
ncbi:hypothetical protein PspLS_03151 [Pyricularia sp. CBS 133598]|nr:hypothetical protein PspLS_03151 [Pyricularia sp. CBS 133598]